MDDDNDPTLAAAGARLRQRVAPVTVADVERAALRRRLRRMGGVAAASIVVALVGGLALGRASSDDGGSTASGRPDRPGAPSADEVDEILASLDDQPVDPTDVQLVASVSSYADCDALVGDLRRVGAEHVGSRGFGGYGDALPFTAYARQSGAADESFNAASPSLAYTGPESDTSGAGGDGGETIGTNVQVEGVDELDRVKAEGTLVYDLDSHGDLRITDTTTLEVTATLDVTPDTPEGDEEPEGVGIDAQVSELLVADGQVALFGSEREVSAPVAGDPSATRASVAYMNVTLVDATDPAAPVVTDRVRIEGGLVSARMVGGEVRMVTTSSMADLGFLMPTTPRSVPTALAENRRIVASSTADDWVPEWQRDGEDAQPLVPCERVYVPDTFAGVAMTSMVTFPMGGGVFEPAGTSILAPGSTLYAGVDRVAISSEVWVDPIDREGLEFDDWQTAIHEFAFTEGEAPGYDGSGIVDGSTVGQFAFGEVGEDLAVVTTEGTPWRQDAEAQVDLTVLAVDGSGSLAVASEVADMADGDGAVTAVRFVEGRVLVSTGWFGRKVTVIDVTDPAAPRRAGSVMLPGDVGYFHPLPDGRALVVGSRSDEVGTGDDRRSRQWVVANMLDVSDADAPAVTGTWERPWSSDEVAYDHHAFTFWPSRDLALWGIRDTEGNGDGPNHAIVLDVSGTVAEVAVPEASKPPEVPAPCPTVEVPSGEARDLLGPGGVALRCDDGGRMELEWPRYQCFGVDQETVVRFGGQAGGSWFACSPAPAPAVSRVLVVDGSPYLLTDQTLERLDPTSFASTAVVHHPGGSGGFS